jgi:hypothetical protein
MAVDYVRKQVILEKEQSDLLRKIAKDDGVSFSELVRNYLNLQLRLHTYKEMEKAATRLVADYKQDNNLTSMTSLDSEDFVDE